MEIVYLRQNPHKDIFLRNKDTQEILKYGETTRGNRRYTKKYLNETNSFMDFQVEGTKREMHDWQHEKILEYKAEHGGQRPPNIPAPKPKTAVLVCREDKNSSKCIDSP